ncbi:hypothetical protein AAC387_Pa02g5047 [Persea americana]
MTVPVIQEFSHDAIETIKEYLKNLINRPEKRNKFMDIQGWLEHRYDLSFEMLRNAHKFQLDVFVTVKTGVSTNMLVKHHLPTTELIEIFLFLGCQNLSCKSLCLLMTVTARCASHRRAFVAHVGARSV